MKTRTVRFSIEEDAQISAFLKRNPLFDFSALTRAAIAEFIQNPKVKIVGIKKTTPPKRPGMEKIHVR